MIFISCTPTRSLVIDIPQSATRELPASIQSLTLVSQAVDEKFTNTETDTLQKLFYKKRFRLDTTIYDVQMADTTLKVLGELLFESGRYDYVIPEGRFLMKAPGSQPGSELNWNDVVALADTFTTDAVLSLDYLRTRVSTAYNNDTYYDPYYEGYSSGVHASMNIAYEALFRVYDPQQKRVIMRELMRDTLYWEDADVSVNALFGRFTSVKQALAETGIVMALDLSEKIAVRWRPERRRFFTSGNSRLKEGVEAADVGDWERALTVWNAVAENAKSKSVRSKALLNAALGYEILGDVDQAILMALESYETMYRPLTYQYLETLRRRKDELTRSK